MPPTPAPGDGSISTPIELTLKADWRYEARRGVFESAAGQELAPRGLPSGTRIEYVVPSLVDKNPDDLIPAERDLQRYIHVVLPAGEVPADYVELVGQWACVAEARIGPEVSLPGSTRPGTGRARER